MKIHGYLRASCEKSTVENQKYAITRFCEEHNIEANNIHWVSEVVSGTKDPNKRKFGTLLDEVEKGDIIMCTEISRLGRSLYMVMDILKECMEKECQVWTIKEGFRLGDDIQTKVLAFAFGLAAEIERNMISQRTREALERKKEQGVKLGRPKGALGKNNKLNGMEETVRLLLEKGNSYESVARVLDVNRTTLTRFCKAKNITKEEVLMY